MNKNDKLFLDLMKNPYKTKSVKRIIDNDNLHNELKKKFRNYDITIDNYNIILEKIEIYLKKNTIQNIINNIILEIENEQFNQTIIQSITNEENRK
tara:strand:+ start:1496 stop:1783 length:288 start_codon:yes stop_codon:yes gene_type:complete